MGEPKLIVLRGPSGSGKSAVAKAVRAQTAGRIALIEQDYFRRLILKEKDVANSVNQELIAQTVQFSLAHGYDVILEGILFSGHYHGMLKDLASANSDSAYFYYFDISFEETLRRHATKPNAHEFGEREMREWYRSDDMLGIDGEQKIPQHYTVEETVKKILKDTGL